MGIMSWWSEVYCQKSLAKRLSIKNCFAAENEMPFEELLRALIFMSRVPFMMVLKALSTVTDFHK